MKNKKTKICIVTIVTIVMISCFSGCISYEPDLILSGKINFMPSTNEWKHNFLSMSDGGLYIIDYCDDKPFQIMKYAYDNNINVTIFIETTGKYRNIIDADI